MGFKYLLLLLLIAVASNATSWLFTWAPTGLLKTDREIYAYGQVYRAIGILATFLALTLTMFFVGKHMSGL